MPLQFVKLNCSCLFMSIWWRLEALYGFVQNQFILRKDQSFFNDFHTFNIGKFQNFKRIFSKKTNVCRNGVRTSDGFNFSTQEEIQTLFVQQLTIIQIYRSRIRMSYACQTEMNSEEFILTPRTLVIENEETSRSIIVKIEVILGKENDLFGRINTHCPLECNFFTIYHPEFNQFVPLTQQEGSLSTLIPWIFLQPRVVLLRYRSLTGSQGSAPIGDFEDSQAQKESRQQVLLGGKERSKERTIKECIDLVGMWRMYHLNGTNCDKEKLNLIEAAKRIGVSKKSLDDYYYQLRLGQFYNFNFKANLSQKIGILRAYVRQSKPKRERKNKNLRHPRHLKVIRQAELEKVTVATTVTVEKPVNQIGASVCSSESTTLVPDLLIPYEDFYFENFEFLFDNAQDPFLRSEWCFKTQRQIEFDDDYIDF